MESDPGFAAAQRWRWRHLFVDEFQDLNPLQHRLLLAWLGSSTDLCVVGDPHQAVYGWNGADPDLLARFRTAGRRPRCCISTTTTAAPRRSWPPRRRCSAPPGPACARRLSDGPPPTVRAYPSETAEAQGIAAGLRGRQRSRPAMGSPGRADPHQRPAGPDPGGPGGRRVPFWSPAQGALLDDPLTAGHPRGSGAARGSPMQMVVADLVAQQARRDRADRRTRRRPDRPRRPGRGCSGGRSRTGWQPTGWRGCRRALSDDPRGPRPTRRRHAVQLSPGQGARMGGGVGRRSGAGPGADRPGHLGGGRSRGAPPAVRGPHPGRRWRCTARGPVSARSATRPVPREASPWLELIRAASREPRSRDEAVAAPEAAGWRQRLRDQRQHWAARARPCRGGAGCRRGGRSPTATW